MLDRSHDTPPATAVGNAVAKLHRERFGRGATTTRTVLQGDFVLVVMQDVYTPAERTLIEAGDWEVVKATRQAFQMAVGRELSACVEGILGRKVVAFMSQVHESPDLSAEMFVLESSTDGA
jgi:uncharacterized protein YbcI